MKLMIRSRRWTRFARRQAFAWALAWCASACVYVPTGSELSGRACASVGTASASSVRFDGNRFSAPASSTPDAGVSQAGTFHVCQPPQLMFLQTDDGRCRCFEIEGFGSALTEFDLEPADAATCARAAIACTGMACDHANSDPALLAALPAGRWSCPRGSQ